MRITSKQAAVDSMKLVRSGASLSNVEGMILIAERHIEIDAMTELAQLMINMV